MIKKRVYENACREGECQQIRDRVGRRKVKLGIVLIRGEVKSVLGIEDAADVVYGSIAVVRVILVYREISEIPCLCGAVRTATMK